MIDEIENEKVEQAIENQDVNPIIEDIAESEKRSEKMLSAEEVNRLKNDNKRLLSNIKKKDRTFRSAEIDGFVRNYLDDPGPLDTFLFEKYPDDDDIQMIIREFVYNKNRILRSR